MFGQAYVPHNLIESKPYKNADPSNVFYYTAYIGVPMSAILSGLLMYFMSSRMVRNMLPMVPVIAFPILVWSIYEVIFAWSGLDFFSGLGAAE